MLINKKQTTNWSAISAVNVTKDSSDVVMYINAIYDGNDISFSKNIKNKELYNLNKQEVDSDYEDFETEVFDEIGE